jgi:tetratricopeptide (TPR) repeat protein
MQNDRTTALLRMLERNPADMRARFGLALEYEKQGRWEEAVAQLREYLAGTEDEGNAWGRLGRCLRELGREAAENAGANGLGHCISAMCSDLLSAISPRPLFDVILSNLPAIPGEPADLADRSWHAGPGYRDTASLFQQARERLAPGGRLYLLLSSESDLQAMRALFDQARFHARPVQERSHLIESVLIYELRGD